MYDINCGSPTVADDMLVCSFSVNGLIQILVLCLRYGHKWRFEHGIMKCLVVHVTFRSYMYHIAKMHL